MKQRTKSSWTVQGKEQKMTATPDMFQVNPGKGAEAGWRWMLLWQCAGMLLSTRAGRGMEIIIINVSVLCAASFVKNQLYLKLWRDFQGIAQNLQHNSSKFNIS